ncbi:MAG: prepilin peptidase [Filifactoraceae bacterium]
MENLIILLLFVIALSLGSFYNVVIYRMPMDIGIVKGRSFCPSCNHSLGAMDLIPLFSFAFLGGRCRYCKTHISLRYPIIEVVTGLLMLLAYYNNSLSPLTIRFFAFWSMLLIVTMIDLDHMFILDAILIFFAIIDLLFILLLKYSILDNIQGALIGGGIYFLVHIISKFWYKREVFGMGDVLLMINIGLFLGRKYVLLACFMPFYISAIVLIMRYFLGKKITLKAEIPFGPYMCVAAFVISLYGESIQAYIINLFGI